MTVYRKHSRMPYKPREKPVVQAERNGLGKPIVQGIEAIKGARSLIRRFGAQVEPALFALLCDKKSSTRESVDKALKGGAASATAILVPLLIGQFALAPAVAAVVAAVAVQALAAAGQENLCEELAKAKVEMADQESKTQPNPKPGKPTAAGRPKPVTRKRMAKKK